MAPAVRTSLMVRLPLDAVVTSEKLRYGKTRQTCCYRNKSWDARDKMNDGYYEEVVSWLDLGST